MLFSHCSATSPHYKANFESDIYPWQLNFSNHTKVKQKISIYILRPIAKSKFEVGMCVIFPSLHGQSNISILTMSNFRLRDYS